jgi:hypothetical protein
MADAGKLLIPDALRKGKDLGSYSPEEMVQLDDHYQRVCDQMQEFVLWEGPLQDPRILLAQSRIATGADLIINSLAAAAKAAAEAKAAKAAAKSGAVPALSAGNHHVEEELPTENVTLPLGPRAAKAKAAAAAAMATAARGQNKSSASFGSGLVSGVSKGGKQLSASLGVSAAKSAASRPGGRVAAATSAISRQLSGQAQPEEDEEYEENYHPEKYFVDDPYMRQRARAAAQKTSDTNSSSHRLASEDAAAEVATSEAATSAHEQMTHSRRASNTIASKASSGHGIASATSGSSASAAAKSRSRSRRRSSLSRASLGVWGNAGASAFDSNLKSGGGRHGFFPSPYGTGMSPSVDGSLPDIPIPEYEYDPGYYSKFRIMLPLGEEPPEGFSEVGRRALPMGDLLEYSRPSDDALIRMPGGLVLQELPASYATDEDREWFAARRGSSAQDSGVLSPLSPSDELEHLDDGDDEHLLLMEAGRHNESGIGSGADSTFSGVRLATKRRRNPSVPVQTEPMPDEFYRLQDEERRRREEAERAAREAERLAREAEERARREQEEAESAVMGDSVMRYLKMIRRNSKSTDHKRADRFRSMNYDPTLRNIKAKYLHKDEQTEGLVGPGGVSLKCVEVQAGEALIPLLKMCKTPVDPTPDRGYGHFLSRKMSRSASDFSDSSTVGSPSRRLSIPLPDGPLLLPGVDRDFFTQLYGGGDITTALENASSSFPEDYFNYLESWYKAQRGLHSSDPSAGSAASATAPATTTSPITAADLLKTASGNSGVSFSASSQSQQQQQQQQHTGIFIPVSAMQNLRNAAATSVMTASSSSSSSTVTAAATANAAAAKQPQSASKSFLSSVISSKPFHLGSSAGSSGGKPDGPRILSKKLWRPRTKSKSRASAYASWTPQVRACAQRRMHIVQK